MDKETMIYPTMKYYSSLKRNELSSQESTWRKLKCVILSERSQNQKLHPGKHKTIETVKRKSVVFSGLRKRKDEQVEHRFQRQ